MPKCDEPGPKTVASDPENSHKFRPCTSLFQWMMMLPRSSSRHSARDYSISSHCPAMLHPTLSSQSAPNDRVTRISICPKLKEFPFSKPSRQSSSSHSIHPTQLVSSCTFLKIYNQVNRLLAMEKYKFVNSNQYLLANIRRAKSAIICSYCRTSDWAELCSQTILYYSPAFASDSTLSNRSV